MKTTVFPSIFRTDTLAPQAIKLIEVVVNVAAAIEGLAKCNTCNVRKAQAPVSPFLLFRVISFRVFFFFLRSQHHDRRDESFHATAWNSRVYSNLTRGLDLTICLCLPVQ
jgi:hypothetical protein